METKWFLKSKTLWGAIIATLPAFLAMTGVGMSEGEAGAARVAGETIADSLWIALDSINELVGLALVIWGRLTAKTKLSVTGGAQ